jgi:ectoine hydroxylase-related dioxygenase (phytanoyl-CoA dioxygenase family)
MERTLKNQKWYNPFDETSQTFGPLIIPLLKGGVVTPETAIRAEAANLREERGRERRKRPGTGAFLGLAPDCFPNPSRLLEDFMDTAVAPLTREMETLLNDPEAIRFHADQIRVNGYCVLENALPLDFIAEMRERFDVILDEYRAAHPTNRGENRFQMFLPFEGPFESPQLYEHPVVLAIVEAVLGPRILWSYLASDTPYPGSDYQRVHSDTQLLFPETHQSLPPYGLVLNVPLIEVTDVNGPLELWPGGTHYMPGPMDLGKLAETMTSVRLTMKEGGVLIRDLRAWHRGTPNRGDRSRPHVALVYTRPWYRFEQNPPTVRRSQLESLSDKAKAMLRFANVIED